MSGLRRSSSVNVLREEDREVTPVIPEEVTKALDLLRKHAADPARLTKMKSEREKLNAQCEEAKKKFDDLSAKVEAMDTQIEQAEKNVERMNELSEFIKDMA
jgi:septal ring factor EnvC (AmiA/AmiB activator)